MRRIIRARGDFTTHSIPALAYLDYNNQLIRCNVWGLTDNGYVRLTISEDTSHKDKSFCKGENLRAPGAMVIPRAKTITRQGITIINLSFEWKA